jgi:hypothetical protein
MKSYIKSIVSFWAMAVLLVSCTETHSVIDANEKPVIEAFLAPGHPVSLKLTTVIGYTGAESADSVARPIDGQQIQIKVSDGSIFTLSSVGEGIYESKATEIVKFGLTYTLDFTYNGLPISATTIIPTRPTGFKISKNIVYRSKIDLSSGTGGFGGPGGFQEDRTPIEASWDNPNGEYHFVALINTEEDPEPIVILPTDTDTPLPPFNRRINNEPTTATVTNIMPQTFQYFGKHYAILYRLNPDYAALYRSTGTTTQNISTPPTSITNGLGIFTGVNADTLIVNVYRY